MPSISVPGYDPIPLTPPQFAQFKRECREGRPPPPPSWISQAEWDDYLAKNFAQPPEKVVVEFNDGYRVSFSRSTLRKLREKVEAGEIPDLPDSLYEKGVKYWSWRKFLTEHCGAPPTPVAEYDDSSQDYLEESSKEHKRLASENPLTDLRDRAKANVGAEVDSLARAFAYQWIFRYGNSSRSPEALEDLVDDFMGELAEGLREVEAKVRIAVKKTLSESRDQVIDIDLGL